MLVTKIDKDVYRFNNQYFYGENVGTYLIDVQNKTVLFDLPTYSKETEGYLSSFQKPLIAILSHGPCGITDGKIWQEKLGLQIYLHEFDTSNKWLALTPDHPFIQSPHIDASIEIIHTPGHSPGSVCLLHKNSTCLFTGDTFAGNKDGSVRNFLKDPDANGDLQQRLESCKKLTELDFNKILPFHYEMIVKKAKDSLRSFIQSAKEQTGIIKR